MCHTLKRIESIYVNGNEIPDVVDFRNRFCDQRFNNYLPRVSYFEGVDMKIVETDFKAGEAESIELFHGEIIFGSNEYQRFFQLGNNEQVLKPISVVRGMMVSEFVCPCHSNMVDPDTGKPSCMILKYGKNYHGCWTGENSTIQLQDTHITFINIYPCCLPLYVFENS